jgi:ribose/xylose/arabinose/galactoside ABC-type transport system permease subunit
LALVPGGAHVLEMAHKLNLDREQYLTAQVMYQGWAWLGAVIIAALISNLVLAILVRRQTIAMLSAALSTLFIAVMLASFFTWTFPVNQATENWTVAPDNWEALRNTWEYSHAANAGLMLLALCATFVSALSADH